MIIGLAMLPFALSSLTPFRRFLPLGRPGPELEDESEWEVGRPTHTSPAILSLNDSKDSHLSRLLTPTTLVPRTAQLPPRPVGSRKTA